MARDTERLHHLISLLVTLVIVAAELGMQSLVH
jgi:hypothetical protein